MCNSEIFVEKHALAFSDCFPRNAGIRNLEGYELSIVRETQKYR